MRLALLFAVAGTLALLDDARGQVHRCAEATGTSTNSGTPCARSDGASSRDRLRETHAEKLDRIRCKLALGRLSARMQLDPDAAAHAGTVVALRQKAERYCGLQAPAS